MISAPSPGSVPSGPGDWLSPGRFALLLGALFLVCFPQVVAGFETFGYLDFGQFAYPVAFYHRESFWQAQFPFWNPLNNCGVPFLAQWNTLTLYPPSLFYLLLPFPWSFGMFGLLHLFLAGMGMYFLANRWTGNRLAGAVAGVVFAFNGLSWYGLIWPHITAALAWMPWVVLAMELAWREGGGRRLVLAGAAAAMQLLSGGAEVILLTWLVCLVFWASWMCRGEVGRAKLLGRMFCVGLLALGLASVQLLPFLDLLAHSQRSSSYSNPNLAVMPLTGWANYLVPNFHCLRNPQGLFVPPNHWTASYFLGMGAVLFALLAIWRARARSVWLLAGLTAFSLLMALGNPGRLYDWVTRLFPLLGFMRFPIKFALLATFTIPLLAACGLGWLLAVPAQSWPRERNRLLKLVVALLGFVGVILLVAWKSPAVENEFGPVAANALVRVLFLGLVVSCLFTLRRVADLKAQGLFQAGLVAVLWFDVFTHNGNLSPTVPPAVFEPDAVRNYYHWGDQIAPGASRLMESRASFGLMMAAEFRSLEHDTAGRRLSQFFDYNLLDHVPKFDGFYSLDLREFFALKQQVYYGTNTSEPSNLMDFAAISRVNNPTNLAEWLTRESCLPLLTAGQAPAFADNPTVLNAVLSAQFDPRRTVWLPLEAQDKVRVRGQAKIQLGTPHFTAHCLTVDVEAASPAMIAVAQTYYHNWRAYIDGQPTAVWRANYAFQAVEVPAGKHDLKLVYQDRFFLTGLCLSTISLLACALICLRQR